MKIIPIWSRASLPKFHQTLLQDRVLSTFYVSA